MWHKSNESPKTTSPAYVIKNHLGRDWLGSKKVTVREPSSVTTSTYCNCRELGTSWCAVECSTSELYALTYLGYVYMMTVWTEDAKVASRLHFLFRIQTSFFGRKSAAYGWRKSVWNSIGYAARRLGGAVIHYHTSSPCPLACVESSLFSYLRHENQNKHPRSRLKPSSPPTNWCIQNLIEVITDPSLFSNTICTDSVHLLERLLYVY